MPPCITLTKWYTGVEHNYKYKKQHKGGEMAKYRCLVCGYVYDPAENDNISFEDLPGDWVCPECGVGKDQFEVLE
jgi:rubredoxin